MRHDSLLSWHGRVPAGDFHVTGSASAAWPLGPMLIALGAIALCPVPARAQTPADNVSTYTSTAEQDCRSERPRRKPAPEDGGTRVCYRHPWLCRGNRGERFARNRLGRPQSRVRRQGARGQEMVRSVQFGRHHGRMAVAPDRQPAVRDHPALVAGRQQRSRQGRPPARQADAGGDPAAARRGAVTSPISTSRPMPTPTSSRARSPTAHAASIAPRTRSGSRARPAAPPNSRNKLLRLSMILSENRFPLFRLMLYPRGEPRSTASSRPSGLPLGTRSRKRSSR